MATWLITGGAGFIGSHLADALLARGDRVRVLDNLDTGKPSNLQAGVEFVRGDVAEPDEVRRAMAGVDGCFHLAAIASVERSTQDWALTHRVNLTGAIHVLEAARARRTPVVYASSAAVFGDQGEVTVTEATPPAPISAYGADKLGCELHARVAAHVFGVPSVGLRFFNVYGPRQDAASPYSGVIAKFLGLAAAGEPITIFGDGDQVRDFVFVGDAVAHLCAAMDRLGARPDGARVLNVCTGKGTRVLELAAIVQALAGAQAAVRHGPARAGDIRFSLGDPSLAREVLGLGAETPLEQGLRLTFPAFG
jgi:UDP-glucose 4-epimerase